MSKITTCSNEFTETIGMEHARHKITLKYLI